jgi:hypothetical protein
MANVYVNTEDRWYHQLASVSNYYEIDIEDRILAHTDQTFRGYHVLKFKKTIRDKKGGSSTPDLVLVREDYSKWYVVEVELFKHGKTHPEKQIDVFIDGVYKPREIVPYLMSKKQDFDEAQLTDLITREQPGVLVIVDGPDASWIEDFRTKVMVCIFEVYKNTNGTELFRLNGDYPYISLAETHVKSHPSNTYELIDSDFLPHGDNEPINVTYLGNLMTGKVVHDNGKKFILIKNSLVPPKKDLVLFTDINGDYILRLN